MSWVGHVGWRDGPAFPRLQASPWYSVSVAPPLQVRRANVSDIQINSKGTAKLGPF